jgi:ribA/ribD-fused uncharacterized protein
MTDFKSSRLEVEIRKNEIEMMKKAVEAKKEKFTFFWAGTFSQWAESPFKIDGVAFNTAEQYMMYKKALLFNDFKVAEKIMGESNPRKQKALGREVKGFDRSRWERYCKQFVYEGSYAKFTQNPKMLAELLATDGTSLVEASPEDNIWGIGLGKDSPLAQSRDTWKGTNWLGEILDVVRKEVINLMKKTDFNL